MTIQPEVMLVTLDVTLLYANIPLVYGLDDCSWLHNKNRVTDISTDVWGYLITSIFTHNNFVLDDHCNLQTNARAIGTKMAPCFANIFMASI